MENWYLQDTRKIMENLYLQDTRKIMENLYLQDTRKRMENLYLQDTRKRMENLYLQDTRKIMENLDEKLKNTRDGGKFGIFLIFKLAFPQMPISQTYFYLTNLSETATIFV